jgi:hypothetical protein
MESEINIMDILYQTVDSFKYQTVVSNNLDEGEVLICVLKAMEDNAQNPRITSSILEYMISKLNRNTSFFNNRIRDQIIKQNNRIIMLKVLRYKELDIFTKEELQGIYTLYSDYEIRNLVEARLWSRMDEGF